MVSSYYSDFIIIDLQTVIWFQVFLCNINDLQAIIWFQVINNNNNNNKNWELFTKSKQLRIVY